MQVGGKPLKLTSDEIEKCRTLKGGFTRATMASWGVPWPPPRGWRQALLAGEPIPSDGSPLPEGGSPDHKALLHQVVMAVINAGQGHLLNELPEVSAYYNCRIPTVEDVIGGRPETAVITGVITFDDKVYSFSCARTSSRN